MRKKIDDEAVYEHLVSVARAGSPCPAYAAIAEAVGLSDSLHEQKRVFYAIERLEAAGRVRRKSISRNIKTIEIPSLGIETAPSQRTYYFEKARRYFPPRPIGDGWLPAHRSVRRAPREWPCNYAGRGHVYARAAAVAVALLCVVPQVRADDAPAPTPGAVITTSPTSYFRRDLACAEPWKEAAPTVDRQAIIDRPGKMRGRCGRPDLESGAEVSPTKL